MEQLYVRKELFPLSEDGPTYLKATDAEVKAAAATLDGAEIHRVSIGDDGELRVDPALLLDEGESYLVIHLRDR